MHAYALQKEEGALLNTRQELVEREMRLSQRETQLGEREVCYVGCCEGAGSRAWGGVKSECGQWGIVPQLGGFPWKPCTVGAQRASTTAPASTPSHHFLLLLSIGPTSLPHLRCETATPRAPDFSLRLLLGLLAWVLRHLTRSLGAQLGAVHSPNLVSHPTA
jgi:hypothetical protein